MQIKQFKVAVPVEDTIQTIDGLEYEGKLWLVSLWADNHQQKISKPERMIRFDQLEFVALQNPNPHHFALQRPIPRTVLEGESNDEYEILQGTQSPSVIPAKAGIQMIVSASTPTMDIQSLEMYERRRMRSRRSSVLDPGFSPE